MSQDREQPKDAAELRRCAEERLREKRKSQRPKPDDQRTWEDTARLVHELQVHQIEMEMQSEELRRARDDIQVILAQYADLYDFAPTGYLTLDRAGAIREVNRAGARLFGVDRSRLVKRRFGQFVAESDRRSFGDFLEKVFASQAPQSCEVALLCEGQPSPVVRIEGSPSADRQECRAVVVDITTHIRTQSELQQSLEQAEQSQRAMIETLESQKRAEAALAASEFKFRELSQEFHGLLDAIPDSLMLLDKDLKVLWANRAATEAIGRPTALEGRYCHDLWYNRSTACEPCPVALTFTTGQPQGVTVTRSDGRIWDIRTVPLVDAQGGIARVIEVKRDIAGQRRTEEQLLHAQKLEGIGQLAGGIAHDFNNVLAAVIGFAGILQMKLVAGDPLRHYTDEILAAGERGAELTRQILTFSRKQVVDLKPARLNDVVLGLKKMLRRLLPENIDIVHDLSGKELGILADVGQLGQVLINLVTNARDAMAGGGTIGIATGRVAMDRQFVESHGYGEPGEYAVLTVTDTGRGMDEATRARVFEPFFTTKEQGKGTGLGMSVVHGIVKQHRGFVNVYSEVGKGTAIRIYLPLAAGAGTEAVAPLPAPVVGGSETILVAEDDAVLRKLSRAVLGQHGYTVIDAEDGADAVAKFAAHRDAIRLVILDGLMPKLGGVEALERIHRISPGVKALFMSGYNDSSFSSADVRGKAAFIQKPVMPADLLRKVREVLDG